MLLRGCFVGLAVVLFYHAPTCSPGEEAARHREQSSPELKDVYAWCIVPFDNQRRSPEERLEMLKKLGLTAYAYDWREEHLPEAEREFALARAANIKIVGVWLWIDAQSDRPGRLSESNQRLLTAVQQSNLATQLWIGFNPNFFQELDDDAAVVKGAEMVRFLSERAGDINCRVALYNHGGWLGDPTNQVRIIEALPECEVGVVYNFHHGHEHMEEFGQLVNAMLPHLWAVNVNGMRQDGPKILPYGAGTYERQMLARLQDAGYDGPIGVLGHVEDADVATVLQRNLEGLLKSKSR